MQVVMPLSLSHKLNQKLYIGQKLQQSLTLLTMDNLSLKAYVDECLLSNPCLERCEDHSVELESTYDEAVDWTDLPSQTSVQNPVETQVESQVSLQDSLKQQINCMHLSQTQRDIAYVIVESLENDGYLGETLDNIACQLVCDASDVEAVLVQVVQQLEPIGVGARHLHECLLLQLDDSPTDQIVKLFLSKYVDILMLPDQSLAQESGHSLDQIQQLRQRFRRLTPSPAGGLFATDGVYIKPELIFHVREHDHIEVEVLDIVGKSVLLNTTWQKHLWQGSEKKFMRHAWSEARSLIHALEQRQETMFKLGCFLAEYQKLFIQHGVVALRPLIMAKVASELDLHESTISRVVSSKYAQTPLGLVHLKCFFSSGLSTNSGQDISIHSVKQRIQNLISKEDPVKPISDQKITLQLKSEGIEIARRTVAKYRESLDIPTSTKRKQYVS